MCSELSLPSVCRNPPDPKVPLLQDVPGTVTGHRLSTHSGSAARHQVLAQATLVGAQLSPLGGNKAI